MTIASITNQWNQCLVRDNLPSARNCIFEMKTLVLLLVWIWSCKAKSELDDAADDGSRDRNHVTDSLHELSEGNETRPIKPFARVSAHIHNKINDGTAGSVEPEANESQPDAGSQQRSAWGASSSSSQAVSPSEDDKESIAKQNIEEANNENEHKRPWGLDDVAETEVGAQTGAETDDDGSDSSAASLTAATKDQNKRMWGTASAENATKTKSDATGMPHHSEAPKLPFTKSARNDVPSHPPPDGFSIKARVYINQTDTLAHLSTDLPHIPYWDCGVTGSTTSPLPIKNAYFRNALSGSTYWAGTDGKHAVLMIALNACLLELNSGESLALAAGDVILLEDVLKPGHKIKPLEHNEISVMFLTLPVPYYHTGLDHLSLPSTFVSPSSQRDPCPSDPNAAPELLKSRVQNARLPLQSVWTMQRIRRLCLGIFGLSVSTLAADFLGKTAPLWLAVGIGGTSFVTAVTWGIVTGGDRLLTHVDWLLEKRKLNASFADDIASDLASSDS
ncbi:hypothetical protein MPSEU_000607400 [Mayamaea pseudoterrestris]|nr:hypothetical protein MPSEU_000607400 [Mayamaea pseudoterrestris]